MEKIVGSSRDRAHAAGVKLDTSGFVRSHDPLPMARVFHWADLDPFTQGYIEALFEDRFEWEDGKPWPCKAFRYLAPETLARIMADCAWGSDWKACARRGYTPSANGGALFWKERQAGKWASLRPLRPCLADDGRVYTPEDRLTIIAIVDGELTYDTICMCEDEYCERLPNAEANARLIAAAPEMYEALKELLGVAELFVPAKLDAPGFKRARAAIAKAEGR